MGAGNGDGRHVYGVVTTLAEMVDRVSAFEGGKMVMCPRA